MRNRKTANGRKGWLKSTTTVFLGIFLLTLSGCFPSEQILVEWEERVEAGEYGWIDFNTGEVKNMDSYSESKLEMLRAGFYPEYSQHCLSQLRNYYQELSIEIRFRLSKSGHPAQFITVSDQASACSSDIVGALRAFPFAPALRDGEPVAAVGVYTHQLAAKGGYRNQ